MNKKALFKCLIILLAIAVAFLKSGSVLNYSTWSVDEQQLVTFAVGFLNFDLNPRWFEYHTLPMYILAVVYFIIYHFYLFLGLVSSKIEFASLLFSNDAVFFISARILCSTVYTFGCFILASIIYKQYQSIIGAIIFLLIAIFLPDAVLASNFARVDSFVFLFLALTVYYSCFTEHKLSNILLSLLFCSAAIASKLPAIVFIPIIFLNILWSAFFTKDIPKKYILLPIFFIPLFTFALMPFALLDFESYKPALDLVLNRTAGEFIHIGKTHSYNIYGKLLSYWHTVSIQTNIIAIICSFALFVLSIMKKDRKLFFSFLFVGAYTFCFFTSATLDSYWLRPIYPFLIFFSTILLLKISSKETISAFSKRIYGNQDPSLALSLISATPLILFFLLFVFFHNDGLNSYINGLQNTFEDNRITASKWIDENISENSLILLDSAVPHYVPEVFSRDAQTTLDISDLNGVGGVSKNKFLTAAFMHYYTTKYNFTKKYVVGLMDRNLNIQYDISRIRMPKGAYVVITNAMYDRFYRKDTMQLKPELAKNAQKFYGFMRKQKHIKKFNSHGPIIDIYQMNEDIQELQKI